MKVWAKNRLWMVTCSESRNFRRRSKRPTTKQSRPAEKASCNPANAKPAATAYGENDGRISTIDRTSRLHPIPPRMATVNNSFSSHFTELFIRNTHIMFANGLGNATQLIEMQSFKSVRSLKRILPRKVPDAIRVRAEHGQCRARNRRCFGIECILQALRNRRRAVRQRDPSHRRFQMSPRLFRRERRNLAGNTTEFPTGIRHHEPAGFFDRRQNRGLVQRANRS